MVLTSSSRKYCRLVSGLASMVNAIEEEPQAGAFGPIQLVAVRLQGFLTALLALLCPSQKKAPSCEVDRPRMVLLARACLAGAPEDCQVDCAELSCVGSLLCVVLRRCALCSAPLCPVWCSAAQCSAVQCSAALCCTMLHYHCCTMLHYAALCSLHIYIIIIIIINRRSGITSHTSHGHKTGTRSMQPVRSVPLGGPVVS